MSEIFHSAVMNIGNSIDSYANNIQFSRQSIYSGVSESKREWINFGVNNQKPKEFIDLAQISLKHNSIIVTRENMIAGDGIEFKSDSEQFSEQAKEEFKRIGLINLHSSICNEMSLFAGSYPQLIFGQDERGNRQLKKIIKPRYETVRLGKAIQGDFGPEITKHYYHSDWIRPRRSGDKAPKPIDVYDINSTQTNLSYAIMEESTRYKWYAYPDYYTISGADAFILDGEIVRFDVAELKNGMNAGYIVTFFREDYSDTNPEKETEIRTAEDTLIKEQLTGASANAKVIVQRARPSNEGARSIEINEIPNVNNEGRHKIMTERNNINILAAHGLPTPELAGIPNLSGSGFASQADKLESAIDIFYWNRIKPLQRLVENFYNDMLMELGIPNVEATILNATPLNRVIHEDLWQWAFDRDEFRESKGYPALTDEQREQLNTEPNQLNSINE